jgi:aryl-alcohol dehydrogenase-like predicted oxidoreductase
VSRLEENVKAAKIQLTKQEVEEVRKVAESAEIRGARYAPVY